MVELTETEDMGDWKKKRKEIITASVPPFV